MGDRNPFNILDRSKKAAEEQDLLKKRWHDRSLGVGIDQDYINNITKNALSIIPEYKGTGKQNSILHEADSVFIDFTSRRFVRGVYD